MGLKKMITEEEFRMWLPTKTIDELEHLRDLINEEIKQSK